MAPNYGPDPFLYLRRRAVGYASSLSQGGGVAPTTDYFAVNGSTQPWYSGATGPNIAYDAVGNKTYIAWQAYFPASNERYTMLRAYNHANQAWEPAVSVGRGGGLKDDDHGVPSLAVTSTGYIVAFWGGHNNAIYIATSKQPRRTDLGWAEYTIQPSKATYWRPISRADGSIDLFYRYDDGSTPKTMTYKHRNLTFAGSVVTPSAENAVGSMGTDSRWYGGDALLRPDGYVWQVATRANYNDDYRKDVYLFKYDIAAKTVTNLNGSVTVAWPLADTDLPNFRLYQHNASTAITGNIPSMSFDDNGRVHISFNVGATAGSGGTQNLSAQDLMHLIITGTTPGTPFKIADLDQRYESGRCVPLSSGQMAVYYPTQEALRGGNIARKVIPANDNGSGISAEALVYSYSPARGFALNEIATCPNAHPDFRVAFGEIVPSSLSASAYPTHRVFAAGDSGILKSAIRQGGPQPTGALLLCDFTQKSTLKTATNGTGDITADGQVPAYVADLSGNGNHLVKQGADAIDYWREPETGFGYLQFGYRQFTSDTPQSQAFGIDNLDLVKAAGFCVTFAVTPLTLDQNRYFFSMDDGTGAGPERQFNVRFDYTSRRMAMYSTSSAGTPTTVNGTSGLIQPGQPSVVQLHYTGTVLSLYLNGVLDCTRTVTLSAVPNQLYFGGDNASLTAVNELQADFHAIVARAGAVTNAQRDADLLWAQSKMFAA